MKSNYKRSERALQTYFAVARNLYAGGKHHGHPEVDLPLISNLPEAVLERK